MKMSHFSDIGFPNIDREQFVELNKDALNKGQKSYSKEGSYFCLQIKPRIEVWACVPNDKSKELGCNPHFNGITHNKVKVSDVIPSDYSNLENAYAVWINEGNVNGTQEYPFNFDCPNFALNDDLVGKEIILQVTAFAETEFKVFKNQQEFDEDKKKRGDDFFGSHTFIPAGQFVKEGQKQTAHAVFAGEVKRVELLKNSRTGQEFYWLVVDSLDADYDVVVDPKLATQVPQVGFIVVGNFWMSGKIVKVL
jgi:hypothetical protein